ncbi:MAG: penicillin-binding protein 1C, partial [Alphaproteobacteria bacterium]|nr:penicillin-binding protein 1C [Alphaproteobacteria bacterium]
MPDYARVRSDWKPSEAYLYDRHGVLLEERRVDFKARRLDWVPLKAVVPDVSQDVIAAEDKRFASHGGVDWLALASSLRARLGGGHARGASTITMQLAGFLAPDLAKPGRRSWLDKIRQMRAAWAIESGWTKPEILEAYLNLAPFRGETQGIAAASDALFGKSPDALDGAQAHLLTALLPDPQADAVHVAARVCHQAPAECGALTVQTQAMLSQDAHRASGPGLAPHLAAHLLKNAGDRVTTTLDVSIQRATTQALRAQLAALGSDRARDGAAVVLDNATGDVLAYVGGAGDASTAGAVDGASGYRQAGSTLKPFLYAMAFEHGWMTPASILDDSPVALDTASGLYVPQDYDHVFKGPVSARTALAGSLNVPAVRTLLLTGVDPFRDRLWDLGYHGLTEDGAYYGYSLALGSAEVTLLEQANAYRALANGGRYADVRLRADDPAGEPRAIMTPQSAWLVGSILSDPAARTVTFGPDSALRLPFWAAAKTGTSKAMRDNWCIGFTDRYTVAVWVGNLEGDPMVNVSGTSGAAPVWRDVMMALHAHQPSHAPPMPAGIDVQDVHFEGTPEPPRREYFLQGTAMAVSALVPPAGHRPHITNPVSGSVFALDPDIPLDRQRLSVRVSGDVTADRILLDRKDIAPGDGAPLLFPTPGSHLLTLVDTRGRMIDQ